MSNSLLTIIREHIPEVKGPARVILMALADRADNVGQCYPSQATIAKDAGVCVSTVKTALRKLRSAGFITWTNTTTEAGDAGSNIYHVTLEGRAGDDQRRTAPAPQVGQDAPKGRAGDGYKASKETPRETSFVLDGSSSNPPPKKSNAKGTLEELKAFAVEIGLPASDGETTFNSWEGNGWTNDKKQIKDWKATIRAWKGKGYLPSQKGNLTASAPPGTHYVNGRAFKS